MAERKSISKINGEDNQLSKQLKHISMFTRMEALFYNTECKLIFMDEVRMNRNCSLVYKRVIDAIAEEKLVQELCSASERTQKHALLLIERYFNNIKTGVELENSEFVEILNRIFQKSLEKSDQ